MGPLCDTTEPIEDIMRSKWGDLRADAGHEIITSLITGHVEVLFRLSRPNEASCAATYRSIFICIHQVAYGEKNVLYISDA